MAMSDARGIGGSGFAGGVVWTTEP